MLTRAFLKRQEELVAEQSTSASSSSPLAWAKKRMAAARRRSPTAKSAFSSLPAKTGDESSWRGGDGDENSWRGGGGAEEEEALPITTESFSSRTRRSLTNFFFGAAPHESAFPLDDDESSESSSSSSASSFSAGESSGGSLVKPSGDNGVSSAGKKMQVCEQFFVKYLN